MGSVSSGWVVTSIPTGRAGIGRRLLDWQEEHAARAALPSTRPLTFGTWSSEPQSLQEASDDCGWLRDRPLLLRDAAAGLEGRTALPDGLRSGRWARNARARSTGDADVEAFEDHWGGFDSSDAAFGVTGSSVRTGMPTCGCRRDGDEIAGAV
jgi:hypothetical protein